MYDLQYFLMLALEVSTNALTVALLCTIL